MSKTLVDKKDVAEPEASTPESVFLVSDADCAWDLFDQARCAHDPYNANTEEILGLIDGADPVDPADIKGTGLEDMSNVNWRKAEEIVDLREKLYHNRTYLEESFASFRIQLDKKDDTPEQKVLQWQEHIARCFKEMLKETPQFNKTKRQNIQNYVRTGHGHRIWADPVSYIDEVVPFANLIVPEDAPADPRKWPFFCVRGTESLHSLFERIQDDESIEVAEAEGWNIAHVRKTVFMSNKANRDKLVKEKRVYREQDYFTYLEEVGKNLLSESFVNCDEIPTVYMFVKEFDGTWTKLVFEDSDKVDDFLYERPEYASDIKHILSSYYMEIPSDDLHYSVKGVIHKMFNEIVTNNTILNSMVDILKWLTSIIMEGGDTQNPDVHKFRSHGNIIMTPTGTTINAQLMNQMRPQGARDLYELLNRNLEQKNRVNPAFLVSGGGSVQPASAEEIGVIGDAISDFHAADIHHYDAQDDLYYTEVYRRVMNPDYTEAHEGWEAVKRFRQKLEDAGIPKKYLDPARLVIFTTPSIGFGSTAFKRQAVKALMEVVEMFDEPARRVIQRMFTSSFVGIEVARTLMPEDEDRSRSTISQREAFKEEPFFDVGQNLPVHDFDNHIEHWDVHFQGITAIRDRLEGGRLSRQEIPTLLAGVTGRRVHMAAHLEKVAGDKSRAGAVKERQVAMNGIVSMEAQIRQLAERLAEEDARSAEDSARREELELNKDQQIKLLKQQNENLLDRLDTASLIEERRKKTDAKIELDRRKQNFRELEESRANNERARRESLRRR